VAPSSLQLLPEIGSEPVRAARSAAQRLVDELGDDQSALEAARVELTQAEQRDREVLAKQMRAGGGEDTTISDPQVERARATVHGLERTLGARRLAVADAEREYRAEFAARREQMLCDAEKAAEKADVRAIKQLDQLVESVERAREAHALRWWLEPGNGLDQERPIPSAFNVGVAKSSAFSQANNAALTVTQLID